MKTIKMRVIAKLKTLRDNFDKKIAYFIVYLSKKKTDVPYYIGLIDNTPVSCLETVTAIVVDFEYKQSFVFVLDTKENPRWLYRKIAPFLPGMIRFYLQKCHNMTEYGRVIALPQWLRLRQQQMITLTKVIDSEDFEATVQVIISKMIAADSISKMELGEIKLKPESPIGFAADDLSPQRIIN
jgi:hypothetical protein